MRRIVKAGDIATLNAVSACFPSLSSSASQDGALEKVLPAVSCPSPVSSGGALEDDKVDTLRRELEELRTSIPDMLERAEAKGREEGKTIAVRDDELRLTKLSESLGRIEKQATEALENSEWLAAMLVRQLLGKLLADSEQQARLIEQTVQQQYRRIDRKTVRCIRVSNEDFPQAEKLEILRQGCRGVDIQQDADLSGGECRIEMQLGYIDLSLPILRKQMERFVDSLIAGGDEAG